MPTPSTNFEDLEAQGVHADIPAAGIPGRIYYETDTKKRYRDNGASWDEQPIDGAPPSGSAGGDLSGTFPNPTVAKVGGVAVTIDTDGTLAANSDAKLATQKAVKTYADQLIAAADAMVFKGVQDCSGNPNYPAADRGHTYRVSVAGKIGGASGVNVEAGDLFICLTDGTSSGTQAGVGSAWTIAQANLDGAVIGPASATDNAIARFDATTGKLIQNSLATVDDSGGVNIPTGQTYNINGSPHTHAAGGDVATDAIWDAKGDLAVGTGANTAQKLTVGSDGQVLTADSTQATGTKWATAGGGTTSPALNVYMHDNFR